MKPISSKTYLLSLIALMIVKTAIDYAVAYSVAGVVLPWWSFFAPTIAFHAEFVLKHQLAISQMIWTFAFGAVGFWLTLRRVRTLRMSAWASFIFFIPVVSLLFAVLIATAEPGPEQIDSSEEDLWLSLKAIGATVALGVLYTALSVYVFSSYGTTLFLASPFVYGALAGYIANRKGLLSQGRTQAVAAIGITLIGGALLLLAMEGVMCIAMAAPLAYATAALGAALGRAIAKMYNPRAIAALVFALPMVGAIEPNVAPLREITSTIEIAAPPEIVWRYIVDVPEMPAPQELAFRVGIAYPVKAFAREHREGAERVCVFDTGTATETITALEPERRLKFHIVSQPDQMREMSPYDHVHAPHLHGFVESQDGEFVLERLANGHTLVRGTSWYRNNIEPGKYWALFTDHFIHMIHERVFAQIKRSSEDEVQKKAADLSARGSYVQNLVSPSH